MNYVTFSRQSLKLSIVDRTHVLKGFIIPDSLEWDLTFCTNSQHHTGRHTFDHLESRAVPIWMDQKMPFLYHKYRHVVIVCMHTHAKPIPAKCIDSLVSLKALSRLLLYECSLPCKMNSWYIDMQWMCRDYLNQFLQWEHYLHGQQKCILLCQWLCHHHNITTVWQTVPMQTQSKACGNSLG